MTADEVERALDSMRAVLTAEDGSLRNVLCREILLGALGVEDDDLDILDLKVINRSVREMRYAFKVFKPYRHIARSRSSGRLGLRRRVRTTRWRSSSRVRSRVRVSW